MLCQNTTHGVAVVTVVVVIPIHVVTIEVQVVSVTISIIGIERTWPIVAVTTHIVHAAVVSVATSREEL